MVVSELYKPSSLPAAADAAVRDLLQLLSTTAAAVAGALEDDSLACSKLCFSELLSIIQYTKQLVNQCINCTVL